MWFSRRKTDVVTDPGARPEEPVPAAVDTADQRAAAPECDATATVAAGVGETPVSTPSCVGESAASVAASVGTVGYAMFALLRTGPLESVPSFEEFLARPVVDDSDVTRDLRVDGEVFGCADVDEHLSAVTRRVAVGAAVNGHAVPSLTVVAAQPEVWFEADVPQPVPSAASAVVTTPADPDVAPVFAHPAPPVRGASTLAMLQEISFLEE